MRRMTIWGVGMTVALAGAVAAQGQESAERAAIEAAIADQLADFAARDVGGAWDHASPMIQGMFGNPETFGRMVEEAYPMVWDNRDADFGDLRAEAGRLVQTVRIADPEGRGWLIDYEMVVVEGAWRINGVWVRPAPDLAA